MSRKSGFPATVSARRESHFAVVIDDVVIGLVPDCSARTATLMARRDISFERIDGPMASDEPAAVARMNAERAMLRGPTLRLLPGGRTLH